MTIRRNQNKALGNTELFTQAGMFSASSDVHILVASQGFFRYYLLLHLHFYLARHIYALKREASLPGQ